MTHQRGPASSHAERLGTALRDLREGAGRTVPCVAQALGWSHSTLYRIESGKGSMPKITSIKALLDHYQADDDTRDALITLTRQARRQRGWWATYRGRIPDQYRTYLGLENSADTIRLAEMDTVPTLLRTAAYEAGLAASVSAPAGADPPVAAEVAQRRRERLSGPDPLSVHAVVGEAALRWQVGGPDVMAGQMQHLVEMASLPHVAVRVLPFSAGALRPWVMFGVLTLPDRLQPEMACVRDGASGYAMVYDAAAVDGYAALFERIAAGALSVEDSAALIKSLI